MLGKSSFGRTLKPSLKACENQELLAEMSREGAPHLLAEQRVGEAVPEKVKESPSERSHRSCRSSTRASVIELRKAELRRKAEIERHNLS